jgi:hypothetical protein
MAAAKAVLAALGGDPAGLVAYAAQLADIRRTYRARVRLHYGQEPRWLEEEFWRERSR